MDLNCWNQNHEHTMVIVKYLTWFQKLKVKYHPHSTLLETKLRALALLLLTIIYSCAFNSIQRASNVAFASILFWQAVQK